MAREKYSIDRQEGKESLLEYAAGLFGDSPENLKTLVESVCLQTFLDTFAKFKFAV